MSSVDDSSNISAKASYYQQLVEAALGESVLYELTTSKAVITQVTFAVEQQIQVLPKPLRLAVRFALATFNIEPILFHRKTFRGLSTNDRIICLRRWESSRIGPKRDLVRFVRSMSLFNFYDHPQVRDKI